ncbi:hypothetical protein KSP39_PZI003759 [Platanthera zijinensis]|uniref:Uncharacterized protein n=1 Tax=Platanthera zijinensis TaxID=2320716 RepID=A0AAP0GC90_9ASPA
MPTIPTALAIDSLFQYNTEESLTKKPSPREKRAAVGDCPVPGPARRPSSQRFHYSPALYATPAPAPIPDVSSIILSPTNYIVNHKRRDARPCPVVTSRVEEFEVMPEADDLNGRDVPASSEILGGGKEEEGIGFSGGVGDGEAMDDGVFDDFLEPQVSVNVGSSGSDVEDGGGLRRRRLGNQLSSISRSQDEYYDTADEFFSDGSASNSSRTVRNAENELHILRLSLNEESSRREVAEEKLLYLNKQYKKLLNCLSHSISSFPELPNLESLNKDINPTDLCQKFVVLKFVSEALEAELARDEIEGTFKGIISFKDHEISRLRDRMQYYEDMNREMSQMNQETVDRARQRRLRRSKIQKWIWCGVGLSITAGASVLAYSYLPHQHHHQDTSSAPSSSSSTAGAE